MLTPAERRLRARAAAYALHAQGGTSTRAGTAAFLNRFELQVDPDGTLPVEERARRAAFARKGYMTLLALRAAKARRTRNRVTPSGTDRSSPISDILGEADGGR
jgi:hypothetical protein